MNFSSADLSTILDRILTRRRTIWRVAKILIQLGLDPTTSRPTHYSTACWNCAGQYHLAICLPWSRDLLCRHTADAARVARCASHNDRLCVLRRLWWLAGSVTTFSCILLLLPINAYRLRQMLNLVRKRAADAGRQFEEWLKPFMTERKYRKGRRVCKKDDTADEMFLTSGNSGSPKSRRTSAGRLMGELGFLSPDNRRTATVECTEDGHVLTITYESCRNLLQKTRNSAITSRSDQPGVSGEYLEARGNYRQNKIAQPSAAADGTS